MSQFVSACALPLFLFGALFFSLSTDPQENRFTIQEPVKQAVAKPQEQEAPLISSKPKSVVDDTKLVMHAKLANAKKVMEGLVTEDFDLIVKGAKQMKRISEAAYWPTTIDEVYQHHSVAFRKQCDKLVKHAERRDLQAAHYTYLHMSTTCFDCHNYVRDRFRVEQPEKGGPIRLIPTQWDGQESRDPPQEDGVQDTNG